MSTNTKLPHELVHGLHTQRGVLLAAQLLERKPVNWPLDSFYSLCSLLHRHARSHERLQEIACNVELNERQQRAHDKREADIERRIRQLAHLVGWDVTFQGDPRGYTVKLHFPTKPAGNTWGGVEDGWGI